MLRNTPQWPKVVLLGLGLIVGSSFGACTCNGWDTVAGMTYDDCNGHPKSCRDLCQSLGTECADASEWDACPADALGLDFGQCEAMDGGVPLDVGCDDPLPYKAMDPNGFEYFACCCQSEVISQQD